jgi:alpha-L-fucosidase
LLDKYHPDFLYFDDTELPFGQTGLDIAAHFYNSNLAVHDGKFTAVMTTKHLQLPHRPAMVEDYERGFPDQIMPLPWQTDTCIGDWHYKKDIQYKSVAQVVNMLIDVVSKNGNLLLSIPVRGDGTLDDRELAFISGLTRWMNINGEGIFASRPWRTFGEGPTHIQGGMFNEGAVHYTDSDIRFTTKNGALYIFVMGIPQTDITVRSLAANAPSAKPIKHITLLGSSEAIEWKQTAAALVIRKPSNPPKIETITFKIAF